MASGEPADRAEGPDGSTSAGPAGSGRRWRAGTFTPGLNPALGTWRPGPESLAERRIREATERGDFAVASKGRRIDLGNVDDPDWWLKRYLAREGIDLADALPAPLALRREAEGFPASLLDLTHADQVRAVLYDYNRRVVAEWRRPSTGRGLPVVPHQVDVETTVEAWAALRAQAPVSHDDEPDDAGAPPGAPVVVRPRWWRRLLGLSP